jgi:hypothetical protein
VANSLLTLDVITREALRLFINSNAFLRNVNRQYDDQFAREGAKIGSALRIRLPNDYTVRTGRAAQPQDTNEQQVILTVATQKGVDIAFASAERALSLDDYSERVLRPAMNKLSGAVATDLMSGLINAVPNVSWNGDLDEGASGTLATPDAGTALNAGARLDTYSCPGNDRRVMLSPFTQARLVKSLAGLFNPQVKIGEQYETGAMSEDTLGWDWFMDQTVQTFTTGTIGSGGITVNGANQTGTTLTVNALPSGTSLSAGDIIYIGTPGTSSQVTQVNRVTNQSTGRPMQFVLTAPAVAGATTLSIYPAIVVPFTDPYGQQSTQYQTVVASPANGAAVTLATPQTTTVRKNVGFYRDAFTLATADLELPRGVHEASRAEWGGVSMRAVTAYDVMSDQFITRLDILYGYVAPRPEWATVVLDLP